MTAAVSRAGIVDSRLLFGSMPGLFLALLPDGEFTIAAVNDTYLRTTLTCREQIVGRSLFDVLADNQNDPGTDDAAGLRASLQRVLATRVPETMPVQRNDLAHATDGDLSTCYWRRSSFPVMDDSGELRYIMYQIEDVTALVQLEEHNQSLHQELQHQLEKGEESRQELESFSYSISHDLRAPLRAIDGFSRMLEEDEGDQLGVEGRRKLEVIRDNTRTMGRLIDALLEFSRLGRKELHVGRLDMTTLAQVAFDNAVNAYHDTAPNGSEPHRPSLSLTPMPDAAGDIALIKQVWSSLLSNAVKFSARCELAHITISAGAVVNGMVIYTVQDNGAGFDMRYYSKMFGMFQRLHRASEFEGTGSGMAMAQRIINRHGGRIWAEGIVGNGAVFHFMLPVNNPVQPLPALRSTACGPV
jgi:signal transduction histidine kinase